MKALFFVEVPLPKPYKAGIDGADLRSPAVRIPFAPRRGDFVIALRGDDYREVESVYYSVATPEEPLKVYFKYDEGARIDRLKELGWEEEE